MKAYFNLFDRLHLVDSWLNKHILKKDINYKNFILDHKHPVPGYPINLLFYGKDFYVLNIGYKCKIFNEYEDFRPTILNIFRTSSYLKTAIKSIFISDLYLTSRKNRIESENLYKENQQLSLYSSKYIINNYTKFKRIINVSHTPFFIPMYYIFACIDFNELIPLEEAFAHKKQNNITSLYVLDNENTKYLNYCKKFIFEISYYNKLYKISNQKTLLNCYDKHSKEYYKSLSNSIF